MSKVEFTASGLATVTCRNGRIEQGTHVVSALPLSVLQDGVSFITQMSLAAPLTSYAAPIQHVERRQRFSWKETNHVDRNIGCKSPPHHARSMV